MNKEENKKMDDEMESVADLLPELSEEDKKINFGLEVA